MEYTQTLRPTVAYDRQPHIAQSNILYQDAVNNEEFEIQKMSSRHYYDMKSNTHQNIQNGSNPTVMDMNFSQPEVSFKWINNGHESDRYSRKSEKGNSEIKSPLVHLVRHAETGSIIYPTTETSKMDCYSVGVIMETNVSKPFESESVRVEAIAPSGRVVKMIGDGYYTSQFKHTEIGEWKVTLFYKDKYLDSCPIDICDPSQVMVKGLKGGVVGKMQEFLIDSSNGGVGILEVDITHGGFQIESSITRLGKGLHRVTYTPHDPGPYNIDVRFNDAEVRDSDYCFTDPQERQRKSVFVTKFENINNQQIKISTSCDWEIDYMTGNAFICHITDGSDIQVYGMNDGTICCLPQLIADCSNFENGILEAEIVYNGDKYPAQIEEVHLNVYKITFLPDGPGIYKIWLWHNKKLVKGSPFIQEIDNVEQPMAFGEGLRKAMANKTASFMIEPQGVTGNITVSVSGPSKGVETYYEPQSNGAMKVYYTATEKGKHVIDVYVDGKEVKGSPFQLWVVDPSLVHVSGGWKSVYGEKMFIPLVVDKEKQIPFDTSEAGFGEMTAEVKGPLGKIPVAIDARSDGKNRLIFTPRTEGHHEIDVYWGGYPLLNSPYQAFAATKHDPEMQDLLRPLQQITLHDSSPPSIIGSMQSDYLQSSTHGSDIIYNYGKSSYEMFNSQRCTKQNPLKIILKGKGLREAYVDKMSYFKIDATLCTEGVPSAQCTNQEMNIHVPVTINPIQSNVFTCTYIPRLRGKYLLYIKWNNQMLNGSPFNVYVREPLALPNKKMEEVHNMAQRVQLLEQNTRNTFVGQDVDFNIDTRNAGPGQLITKVIGPHGVELPHNVLTNDDETMKMSFVPDDVGTHVVDILFNGGHIHGSPYYIDIKDSSSKVDVKVWGPGIENGVIGNFKSHFWVEISGAGAGELRVKVIGPKGAFHVKIRRASKNRKLYQCFYSPLEHGQYVIEVLWSGKHIDGSPFSVYLANNKSELNNYVGLHGTAQPHDVLY